MTNKLNNIGKKTILLLHTESEESAGISLILKEVGISTQYVATLSELKIKMREASFLAVIMDLDSVAVDNRSIKGVASAYPATPFLCISKERFHPDLKDSIRDHIYACLTKPIDPDELSYLLKCIQKDDRKP